jgi:hypothetical protein
MSVGIAGIGWVTPLGSDLEKVFALVQRGFAPAPTILKHPEDGRALPYLAAPPEAIAHLSRNPRLRRSSTISYLGVAAGLAAIEQSGLAMTSRTAVVFAVSDGGVAYTRRFYEQIVRGGANTASPLLFPETVYNAPASHLAAQLGIDGASYTLVGDASVGLSALHFAAQLIETGDTEHAVVVGAEECDWSLCNAYREWRLARTPLAEGAAALVLAREGKWRLHTHPGAPFFRRREAGAALARGCDALAAELAGRGCAEGVAPAIGCAVCSANGTWIDRAEASALAARLPGITIFSPKKSFGESPGASALQQIIVGALTGAPALVTVVGFSHQAAAAMVEPYH